MTNYAIHSLENLLTLEEEQLSVMKTRVETAAASLETAEMRVKEKKEEVEELKMALAKLEE
jgi:chromosome segregation ATPase